MERFANSCVREDWVLKYNFSYAHAIESLRCKLSEFCISTASRTKRGITFGDTSFCWRRWRDLNSRAGYPTYTLSRGASSASWVHLRVRVTRIIRTSLKAKIFGAFRFVLLARLIPCVILRTKNHLKILGFEVGDFLAEKYLSAAGKRCRLYINTIKAFNELMANICRQKTGSGYSCHPTSRAAVCRTRG